jgi:putative nucleotidyltransferase with HDIG domain
MNASRFLYRTRQFWQAINPRTTFQDMEQLAAILTPAQIRLFQRMHSSEQAHSWMVFNELQTRGEENTDLLTAALLHDVGKTRAPLRIWERVMVVLVRAICPGCVRKWGAADNQDLEASMGWRRAFIVAEQHAAWGADIAAASGASPSAVALIARHQEQLLPDANQPEDVLLRKLQSVDDNY